MKRITKFSFALLALSTLFTSTFAQQGMGVGNNNPLEMLDVSGAIKVGTDNNNSNAAPSGGAGTIRFKAGLFEGWDGSLWVPLGGGGSSPFLVSNNLVQPDNTLVNLATDDFIFGSPSLDDNSNTNNDGRFFFDKSKSAFRAGLVTGDQWDDVKRGNQSFAAGFDVTASGNYTIAMGERSWATDIGAIAMGRQAYAEGEMSFAWGNDVQATGIGSVALGRLAFSTANYSYAIGTDVHANAEYSMAVGKGSNATASSSIALGKNADATAESAFALGHDVTAGAYQAAAIGYDVVATGENSIGFGHDLFSLSEYEVVLGRYNSIYIPSSTNSWVATDRLFTIGNGTSLINRSDAFTILKNGNVGIGTSTPGDELHVDGSIRMVDGNEQAGFIPVSDANGKMIWTDPTTITIIAADPDGDPTNELQTLTQTGTNVTLSNGGGTISVADNDNSTTNEIQTLSVSGADVTLSNGGGTVTVNDGDWTVSGSDQYSAISGNVGVGANTPDSKLHVQSNTNDETGGIKLTQGSSNSLIYHNADNDLVIRKSFHSDQLVLDNGGSIGIGTATPGNKLHVEGSIRMVDGNQQAGFIPVSDANGKMTWTDPTGISGSLTEIVDADGDTKIQVEESADEDVIRFDLGGTEHFVMDGYKLNVLNSLDGVYIGQNVASNISTGYNNVAIGTNAITATTSGYDNTAIGYGSLSSNTTGSANTSIGAYSLLDNTTGSENVALGYFSLRRNTTGLQNIGIGRAALRENQTSDLNLAIGYFAARDVLGEKGVYLGNYAGFNATGSQNVFLGYSAGYSETGSNKLYIENSNSNSPLIYGEFDNDIVGINGNLGIGTQAPQDKLHVEGAIRMVDGNQQAGYLPVSDANGKMTWTDPATITTGDDGDWTVSGTDIYNANSGNVGIGNTSPLGKLDIQGGNDGDVLLRFSTARPWSFIESGSGTLSRLRLKPETNEKNFEIISQDESHRLVEFRAVNAGSTVGMIPDGTGKVTVAASLTINMTPIMTVNSTGNKPLLVGETANSTGVIIGYDGNDIQGRSGSNLSTNGDLLLNRYGGNVGIGTGAPSQKLHVEGSIQMVDGNQQAGFIPVSDANGKMTWTDPIGISGSLDEIVDADNDTKIQVEESADEDKIRFDIAGSEAFRMERVASGASTLSFGGTSLYIGNAISSTAPDGFNVVLGNNAGAALQNTSGNVLVGSGAGRDQTVGLNNTFLGLRAGLSTTVANDGVMLGAYSGENLVSGDLNVVVGVLAAQNKTEGGDNVIVGAGAGQNNAAGASNVMIGQYAGRNATGSANVFLGTQAGQSATGSNKLYVENSASNAPLIYGEFDNDVVGINGNLGVGTQSPSAKLHVSGSEATLHGSEAALQITNTAAGGVNWSLRAGATGTQTPAGGFSIADDGGYRMVFNSNGDVGVGTVAPEALFHISSTSTGDATGIKLTQGIANSLFYHNSDNDLIIRKAGQASQLTLDNGGNVGVNTFAPTSKFHVIDNFANASQFVATIENTGNGGYSNGLQIKAGQNTQSVNNRFISFVRPNGAEIGAIRQITSASVDYNTTSDERLKTNINPTTKGLNDLMQIEVKDYVYKEDLDKPQTGFIAQQVFEHYPNAVSVGGDDVKTDPWMMDYGKMSPLLVKAIQDLKAEKDQLETLVETLLLRVEQLEQN